MKIIKAKYHKDVTGTGQNTSIIVTTPETSETHTISVPIKEGNADYQKIQEWVAAGNTIEEAD
jgi:hypothetical protein